MRKITTILFDLDGTLIRMDQDRFIELYFTSIVGKLASLGYDSATMQNALEKAVIATLRNDGACTNEQRFWNAFDKAFPGVKETVHGLLDDYYATDFVSVLEQTCAKQERAREVLDTVKSLGFRPVLATNPLFPIVATHRRMALGGLSPLDFEYVTAYENSSFCKPNTGYFIELLDKLGISPDECVMIGNDTRDDFSVLPLGIPVFVLTDCLINRDNVDLSLYPHGSFDELIDYLNNLK